jgi:hypothetical protein
VAGTSHCVSPSRGQLTLTILKGGANAAKSMKESLQRMLEELIGRVNGPLAFRLIIQPSVAAIIAIRAGWKDARERRPAYGWAIVNDPVHRRQRLREGWKDVAKVFVAAVVIDSVYEIIVFHRIYLHQPLIVAATLAVVPYLLIRGPVNRVAQHWMRRHQRPQEEFQSDEALHRYGR